MDFPECTTLRSHCSNHCLQRFILNSPPRSVYPLYPASCWQTPPPLMPPPLLLRGPQVNASFCLFCNLCFLFFHAPSHSYTGVVISLFGPVASSKRCNAKGSAGQAVFHCYFKPLGVLTPFFSFSADTHTSCCLCVGLSGHCCSCAMCHHAVV